MKKKILMLGATGAVGGQALKSLLTQSDVERITILGRRPVPNIDAELVRQHNIDIFEPDSYLEYLTGHDAAICTLGVGQPSKISRAQFLKIDKQAVITFAKACKNAGVNHFSLLSSVGQNHKASNFYLRSKGELVEEIKALNFSTFSNFQPSMILTPKNRYGFMQGLTLAVWPLLHPLLFGGLKKYRGIQVEKLGSAIAKNVFLNKKGVEELHWSDFNEILQTNIGGW